jgi:hypothetical protein
MNIVDQLNRVIAELRGTPSITVREPRIERAEFPLDGDYEAELVEECDALAFDDAMRSVWNHVDGVEVVWTGTAHRKRAGGILAFEPLKRFAQTIAWTDADLEAMGPRNDMEAALLRELHPIDVRDGGMWAAIRMRPREPYELWYRKEVDLRLQGRFSDYLDLLFKARGADFWPLLLLDLDTVALEHTDHLGLLLKQLRSALNLLEQVEAARADARELLGRVSDMERVLRDRKARKRRT